MYSILTTVLTAHTQTVLSEAANEAAWEVRVAPKYLVPDTNCFVDKLPSIRLLLHSGFYTLAVPLTGKKSTAIFGRLPCENVFVWVGRVCIVLLGMEQQAGFGQSLLPLRRDSGVVNATLLDVPMK